MFPLLITAVGILACLITTLFATDIPGLQVTEEHHIERNLKLQLLISTLLMTPLLYILAVNTLPEKFVCGTGATAVESSPVKAYLAVLCGLWAGLIIGFFTEYMTSHTYTPVREVARGCDRGGAINIILGLALGYKSTIVPVFALSGTIYAAFKLAELYGVALAALGMLSTLAVGLTIDAYGPIRWVGWTGSTRDGVGLSEARAAAPSFRQPPGSLHTR